MMRLILLAERRYPPYSTWLGTAFARTPAGRAHAAAADRRDVCAWLA